MNFLFFFFFFFEKKNWIYTDYQFNTKYEIYGKKSQFFGNFILFLQIANFTFIKNFVNQNCRLIHEQQIHNVTEEFFF